MENIKICEICGSDKWVSLYRKTNQYLCSKHRDQMNTFGKIKRTKYDPNEIVVYEDCAEVILYNEDGEEVARTIISLDKIDIVKEYKWHINDLKYVVSAVNKKQIFLHKLLLDTSNNMKVDHINGNPLDNRNENLRICTQQENACNRKLDKRNKSGAKGICWVESRKKWIAQITVNYKYINLGYFEDKNEAIRVRKEAEEKYFGEYNRKEEVV